MHRRGDRAGGRRLRSAHALVPAESLHPRGDPQGQPPLVVPASAVLWTGVRSLVYVRVPGEEPVFRGQEVVLGPRAGDVYVVREGLEEGQEVVTRGAFKLDSALQIEARPAMMLPEDRGPARHAAPASLLAALDPVFAAYLDLQRGLAGDDLAATQAAARALAAAVQGVDPDALQGEALAAWLGLARRLRDDAASVAAAPTFEAAPRRLRGAGPGPPSSSSAASATAAASCKRRSAPWPSRTAARAGCRPKTAC
ncbi:MAG: hypothetical protein R3F62_22530 [Planctomycetota bacterium]